MQQIIPDGDVILVVGLKKSKIQLSSHLLRTTSPVFAAMLGPSFKEGTLLRESQGPTEIFLPEDNAEALWNIYSTLYGAHPRVNHLKPAELYNISIVAHKYDLVSRLSPICELWFEDTNEELFGSVKIAWKMMMAAYWLDNEFGFGNLSQTLIKAKVESFYRHGMETSDQVLGLKICCK